MNNLPEKYSQRHEYCINVYNQITSLIVSIEKSGVLKSPMKLKEGDTIDNLSELSGLDLYNWLKEKDYSDVILEMNYKECFAALSTDMLQFILTSLNCSEKGQLNVTYALLRKPLKDNLFYLEYLLAYPGEYLKRFNDPKNVEILAFDSKQPEEIKRIIKGAIEKVVLPGYDENYMYDLRYNKKNSNGFEQVFELANHLITKHQFYRTEEGNFNFIFSDKIAKESQWDFLYLNLPILMLYIFQIISSLSSKFIELPKYWPILINKFTFGLLYVTDPENEVLIPMFGSMFEQILPVCEKCGDKIVYDKAQFQNYYEIFKIKCSKCNNEISFCD
jgi:hypothetical protein